MTPQFLHDRLPYAIRRPMEQAMMKAASKSRPPDFSQLAFSAAWEWLHYFCGAGKRNAYGPLEQGISDDANSHRLRGFLVGWAMCEAMHQARADLEHGDGSGI